jgi:cysteine desulfurase
MKLFARARPVYLDANATTPVSPAVRRAMLDVLDHHGGNPSAVHRAGRDAQRVIEAARARVAAAINATPAEITFTSGATEANNTVLRMLAARATPARNRLVTSPVEHSSVRAVAEYLATQGVEVVWLPVDAHGRVRREDLDAVLDERVFLVSLMLANNELGTLNPVAELAQRAHGVGALFHADCVQALGKIAVDVRELGIDYASFSAHKLYGPKGIGVLYAREGAPVYAHAIGGHQERGLRAGTEAVHDIAGCGEAFAGVAALLAKAGEVTRRRDALREALHAQGVAFAENSPRDGVIGNTLNLRFPGVRNSDLLAFLDAQGIAVSAGSACAARGGAASHVLKAIGLSDQQAQESLRLSLGPDVSDEDILRVARRVGEFVRGEAPPVTLVNPADVDAGWLDDAQNYVLDVRFGIERRLMKGLPAAHEIPFTSFNRHLGSIPRDRNVLVVCSTGVDASVVAYALKAQGHPRVGLLVGGVVAWRALQP